MPTVSISSKQFANFQEQLATLQSALQEHGQLLAQLRADQPARSDTFLQKELEAKLLTAQSKLADLSLKNAELQKQLDTVSQSRPHIGVDKLLEQFRNNLDAINKVGTEARTGGKRSVVVEQMEVEVKGGLDLQGGIQLTQLLPQEVTPESVSTIRFSLRPASTIKIVDEGQFISA
jgi:uncharacterized FAD-dependent dehydrogenase